MASLEKALEKCKQLHPSKQEIGIAFVLDAFSKNMTFTISEVRRTYERQCLLFSQGRQWVEIMRNVFPYGFRLNQQQMLDMKKIYDEKRNLDGPKVTWTLNSEHLTGMAMDIYVNNTTYPELALLASRWNILQNIPKDLPHFSFTMAYMPKVTYTLLDRLAQLEKRKERAQEEDTKMAIQRMIDRLKKRKSV